MIEELLKYSTDLPELRNSGLPCVKQDYLEQKAKYLKSQNLSLNEKKPTIDVRKDQIKSGIAGKAESMVEINCNLLQIEPHLPRISILFKNGSKFILLF